VLVLVNVNVNTLPLVPCVTEVGETVIVPLPLVAANAATGALINKSGRAPVMKNLAMRFLIALANEVCINWERVNYF
jgi:hypothetical protein